MAKRETTRIQPRKLKNPDPNQSASLNIDTAATASPNLPEQRITPQVSPNDAEGVGPIEELGRPGLKAWAGRINEEWLPELTGIRGKLVYREMRDNDPTIGAIMFAIEMLIRQVEWRVEPKDKTDAAQEAADFIKECLDDMELPWRSTLSEIVTMLTWGWDVHEIVYKHREGPDQTDPTKHSKYKDGKLGWRKLGPRSQDTLYQWDLALNGDVKGMVQILPTGGQLLYIPWERLLLFRTTTNKSNPEGRSILRNAYRPYFFKKRIEEVEAIGIERDLAGLPVMYVPASIMKTNASASDKALLASLKTIVTNIRRDEQEGVIMPNTVDPTSKIKLYELELLSTGGQRQNNSNEVITRYDHRIAMTVLADFILLGQDKVGSFALSSDKTEIFSVALGALLDEIINQVNRFAIPRLCSLNSMNMELCPVLKYGDIESIDLDKLGNFLQRASAAGMPLFPDRKLEDDIRAKAGMPPVPEDDGTGDITPHEDAKDQLQHEGVIRDQTQQQNDQNLKAGPELKKPPAFGKKSSMFPLYVYRPVLNGQEIVDWAKNAGFGGSTMKPDDLHVTVAFSRDPVDWSKLQPDSSGLAVAGKSVEPLGDEGASVLKVDDNTGYLVKRFQYFKDAGASWDHDGYGPHVTIAYGQHTVDLAGIVGFPNPIWLGPEKMEPLDKIVIE